MRTETFEGWLEDKFVGFLEIGGVPIIKDNCEDMFSGWLENRDVQEMIDFAEEFAQKVRIDTEEDLLSTPNSLPHTTEEVLQNLQHNGIDQNFLEREAHEKGIDFDERDKGEPDPDDLRDERDL